MIASDNISIMTVYGDRSIFYPTVRVAVMACKKQLVCLVLGCSFAAAPHHEMQNGHMVVVTFSSAPRISSSAFWLSNVKITATCASYLSPFLQKNKQKSFIK